MPLKLHSNKTSSSPCVVGLKFFKSPVIENRIIEIISSGMQKNKWTFKDKLEIVEAIFTIVVSVMAIWGTLVAWENGFWHKLEKITDHLHREYMTDDKVISVEKDATKAIKKVQKII